MRLEERTVLGAPAEPVWAALTDWEGQAAWMPDVAWVRVLGPERGAGARLAVRTKVLGIPATMDLIEVTGWEVERRIAVRHLGLVKGWGEWRIRPTRGGEGTLFRWVEELSMPPPVLGEVALRLYGPVQRLMLRRSVRNLRAIVEQTSN